MSAAGQTLLFPSGPGPLFDARRDLRLFDGRTRTDRPMFLVARQWAAGGGVALHVWQPPRGGWPGAPRVFLREARAGRPWAHLFDQDVRRLQEFARRLGVRRIVVHHADTPRQHVDLCGGPLDRAMLLACEYGTVVYGDAATQPEASS